MQRPSLLPTSTDPHRESESSWEEPLYTTAEGTCGVERVGHICVANYSPYSNEILLF